MKPEEPLKVGDEVWIYDCPMRPLEAVITHTDEWLGYKVKIISKGYEFLEKKSYSYFNIFKRPAEWSELVDQLRDDATTLEDAADKLQRKYEYEEEWNEN